VPRSHIQLDILVCASLLTLPSLFILGKRRASPGHRNTHNVVTEPPVPTPTRKLKRKIYPRNILDDDYWRPKTFTASASIKLKTCWNSVVDCNATKRVHAATQDVPSQKSSRIDVTFTTLFSTFEGHRTRDFSTEEPGELPQHNCSSLLSGSLAS